MKKIFMFAALCLLSAMTAMAQDKIYVADFSIEAGQKKTVDLVLDNPANELCAFQFEMYLPEGISIAKKGNGKLDVTLNADRIEGHTLSCSKVEAGHYRFLCYSLDSDNFYDSEGAIAAIVFEAEEGLAESVKEASMKEIKLSTADEQKVQPLGLTFNITVTVPVGIETVAFGGKSADVYDLKGSKVRSNAASLEGLAAGVYIVNGQKVTVK